MKAYVLAIIKRGAENEVAEKVRNIINVTDATITYGIWDLIAQIETKNLKQLNEIISDIRRLPEIEQTNTLIST